MVSPTFFLTSYILHHTSYIIAPMQLVVPIAVSAADAAAMMILSRISPHDVFFILFNYPLSIINYQFKELPRRAHSLLVLVRCVVVATATIVITP